MKHENDAPLTRFERVDQVIFRITKWISYLVGAAILAIMLLALVNVLVSKIFKFSIPSSTEWITYLNILAVFPAVAFVQLDRGHTRVDLFDNKFSPVVQKIIEIFGDLVGMGVCALVSWRAFVLFEDHIQKGTMSSSSALTKGAFPLWPFSLMLSVFCALWFLTFGWSIVRCLVRRSSANTQISPKNEGGDTQ